MHVDCQELIATMQMHSQEPSGLVYSFDLLNGYWQVEVEKKDQAKTTFCTREGFFEFKVMAPAIFQRLMDVVLAGLKGSHCLDDIIILGKIFEQHLLHLYLMCERICDSGLKVKTSKCSFL